MDPVTSASSILGSNSIDTTKTGTKKL